MTPCDKPRLSAKILAHLDVKYHMTTDLLISHQGLCVTLKDLKGWADIPHFLADGIPPQVISIFCIKFLRFLHTLRDCNAKFVSAKPIARFLYLFNNAVPCLKGMFNPPRKCGLVRYSSSQCKFSSWDRMGALAILQR